MRLTQLGSYVRLATSPQPFELSHFAERERLGFASLSLKRLPSGLENASSRLGKISYACLAETTVANPNRSRLMR